MNGYCNQYDYAQYQYLVRNLRAAMGDQFEAWKAANVDNLPAYYQQNVVMQEKLRDVYPLAK